MEKNKLDSEIKLKNNEMVIKLKSVIKFLLN